MNNLQTTERDSDERTSSANANGDKNSVPRSPLQRLISPMQFLESYEQDVTKLETAPVDLMAKDTEIHKLLITNNVLAKAKDQEIELLKKEKKILLWKRSSDEKKRGSPGKRSEQLQTEKQLEQK